MPEIFEQTFLDFGTSLDQEGVELLKCDPNYCVWFADKDCIELSTDIAKMGKQIERHEGKGGSNVICLFCGSLDSTTIYP